MRVLALLFLIVAAQLVSVAPAHAGDPLFPILACPAVGDEFNKLISKLDNIKTSVRKDGSCDKLTLKVESLEELVTKDREIVLDIIANAADKPLTPEQSKIVREYAENVTKKVAALNDLFSQSNYCFKDDKADRQLGALAGFVGEAANLVGSLTGPYGAPIALAGNVVAGFLTGFDQILKTRAGYDFTKRDQWVSYVNNLCTYFSYRDQIEHLLNPRGRIAILQEYRERLDQQIRRLSNSCEECRLIVNAFETRPGLSEAERRESLGSLIVRAENQTVQPLATTLFQSLGLREWLIAEMRRVQKEANSYWADASGRYRLSQAKSDLEDFLIERQAPKFIQFGLQDAHQASVAFVARLTDEGRRLYMLMGRSDRNLLDARVNGSSWIDPVQILRDLVLYPIAWDRVADLNERAELQYAWTHYRDQSLDRFRQALATTQMVQSFCSFFQHAGLYTPALREQCGSARFRQQLQTQLGLAREFKDVKMNVQFAGFDESEPPEVSATPFEATLKRMDHLLEQ